MIVPGSLALMPNEPKRHPAMWCNARKGKKLCNQEYTGEVMKWFIWSQQYSGNNSGGKKRKFNLIKRQTFTRRIAFGFFFNRTNEFNEKVLGALKSQTVKEQATRLLNIGKLLKDLFFLEFFFFFLNFFVGPRPILWSHWLPLFSCDPPMSFKAGWFSCCTLACMCAVNLRDMSGATTDFSTSRVHCMYNRPENLFLVTDDNEFLKFDAICRNQCKWNLVAKWKTKLNKFQ